MFCITSFFFFFNDILILSIIFIIFTEDLIRSNDVGLIRSQSRTGRKTCHGLPPFVCRAHTCVNEHLRSCVRMVAMDEIPVYDDRCAAGTLLFARESLSVECKRTECIYQG